MTEVSGARIKDLILCADDFALNASVSTGIASLAGLGRLSATSAMVLSPRWASDAALLRELRGRVDVGLHLDWTSEFALAAGHGLSLGAAMRQSILGGFNATTARTVIEHQLDAFEAIWQAPPDFVDGHQHVQQFDGIRQALVQALVARYGAQGTPMPYLRVSRAPAERFDLKCRVITTIGANALEKIAAHAGLKRARALFGIYDFSGNGARYAALMAQWLRQAEPGSIVMCHPASASEPGDAIGAARAIEYAYLSGPGLSAALASAGVRWVRGESLTRATP